MRWEQCAELRLVEASCGGVFTIDRNALKRIFITATIIAREHRANPKKTYGYRALFHTFSYRWVIAATKSN